MRPLAAACLALAALPLHGCCSMARLFCGPDRTPWVSERFRTPEEATQTFLEALRRDDPEVVYLCLSNDFRQRLGLDSLTTRIAWQRLREQYPGLHVVGYATVPPAERHDAHGATVHLDVEGNPFDVELVRQSYWEVRYRRPDGSVGECGAPIDSFVGFLRVEVDENAPDDRSRLDFSALTFLHAGLDDVPLDAIEQAGFERRWKIAALRARTN